MNRRKFIMQTAIGSSILMAGAFPFNALADTNEKLTILHTNDVHGRLHPFGDNGLHAGLGGAAQRLEAVNSIRAEQPHTLLFDAGDMFHGAANNATQMIDAMNGMRYDAATIGNHDFDGGVDYLAQQVSRADFPIVIANYNFTGTAIEYKTQPYAIIKRNSMRVGVFGLGIELEGLADSGLYGNTACCDPMPVAKIIAEKLKTGEHCDMVICLSHLGLRYEAGNKVCDMDIAKESEYIDLIIGGHSHIFLEAPISVKNKNSKEVFINQEGWGGIKVGRMDYVTDSKKKTKLCNAHTVVVGKQTRGK